MKTKFGKFQQYFQFTQISLFFHADKIIKCYKFEIDCSFFLLALPLENIQSCLINGLQCPDLALLVPLGHGVDEEIVGMLLNSSRS